MFPSLLSTNSSSRWYHKRPTQKEKLTEIEIMEEKLAEQRMADKEVGVRILIRGKPAVTLKTSHMNEQEDEHDDLVASVDEGMDEVNPHEVDSDEDQGNQDFHSRNSMERYTVYNAEEEDDDDNDRQPSSDNSFSFQFSHSSP